MDKTFMVLIKKKRENNQMVRVFVFIYFKSVQL